MGRNLTSKAALITVVLMVLAGCGTVNKIKAVGQTASNLAHGTTGDKKLDALIAQFGQGTKAVFVAQYKVTTASTGSNGTKPGVYRVAQKPPKSRFETGDAGSTDRQVIIDDGTNSIVCSPGASQCLESPGSGGSGVGAAFAAGAFGFLNPTVFIGALRTLAPLAGVKVDTKDFTKSLAGQDTSCVSATVSGGGKPTYTSSYCATKDGVLAYSDDGQGTVVELTSYDSNVSDSEFTPPLPVTTDPTQAFAVTTLPETTTSETSTTVASSDTSTTVCPPPDTSVSSDTSTTICGTSDTSTTTSGETTTSGG